MRLEGSKQDPRAPFHDYQVSVFTSDVRNAGTDGDVALELQGALLAASVTLTVLPSLQVRALLMEALGITKMRTPPPSPSPCCPDLIPSPVPQFSVSQYHAS